MKKLTSIYNMVAVAATVICTMFVYSCEKPSGQTVFNVSVKTTEIAAEGGQMFVNVKADGNWSLSLVSSEGTVDWASLSVNSGTGSKSNVVLKVNPNGSEQPRILRIIADDGARTSECSVTQKGNGNQVDPEPGNALEKTGWLELPAMGNPDLGYISHSFKMNGKTYRNYSFAWSQDDLVALWVAYPLCSMYTNKTVGRTDAWAYDPKLGEKYSSAPFGGYGGSYARGHQIASADRLCSYEANAQTFYGSNMTPQLNAHNEGIWQTMENQVRNWANTSDTTYVVTGCVVAGSKEFTQDSDGKKMTVPVAYYKALLRYSKSSTISKWAAMAFYTEHKSYAKNTTLRSLAMSVDELEELVGVDFFVNLPAEVGESRAAEIEAEDPLTNSVWGL